MRITPAQTLTYSISGGADALLFSINSTTGVLSFITAPNFESPTDSGNNNVYDVEVTVTDNGAGFLTDVQDLAITITNINEAPVVSDISKSGTEDNAITFAALDFTSKFADVDGNSLTKITVVTLPANGTLKVSGSAISAGQEILFADLSSITFEPAANWNGTTSFDWNASDGSLYAATAEQVNITISAVNDAPVAYADNYSVNKGGTLTVALPGVLSNDMDTELNTLTAVLVTGPSQGILTLNSNGSFVYTHNGSGTLSDSFTYKANDGTANSNTVTVNITVNASNHTPVASDLSLTTTEDTPVNGKVTATDTDGDPLSFAKTTNPAHGQVVVNTDGTFTYTPDANYNGTDSFTVTVSDGKGGSATVTISVTVTPVNDPPMAPALSVTTPEDTQSMGR